MLFTSGLVSQRQGDLLLVGAVEEKAAFSLRGGALADWTVFLLPKNPGASYAATYRVEARYLVGSSFELGAAPGGESARLPPRGVAARAFGNDLTVYVRSGLPAGESLSVSVFAVPSRVVGWEVELDGSQNPPQTAVPVPFFARSVFAYDFLGSVSFLDSNQTKLATLPALSAWIPLLDRTAFVSTDSGEGPLKFRLID